MEKKYFIYILTNKSKTVLYIGVTNNLERRIEQHRRSIVPGFTEQYRLTQLIYYESFPSIRDALNREKQLKGWRRNKKEDLIRQSNPNFEEVAL